MENNFINHEYIKVTTKINNSAPFSTYAFFLHMVIIWIPENKVLEIKDLLESMQHLNYYGTKFNLGKSNVKHFFTFLMFLL